MSKWTHSLSVGYKALTILLAKQQSSLLSMFIIAFLLLIDFHNGMYDKDLTGVVTEQAKTLFYQSVK